MSDWDWAAELAGHRVPSSDLDITLLRLTRLAYPWPKWALSTEIPNEPGFYARRRIDAMAFAMWSSQRHRLVAFEFKATRSDWLRELKQPEKCQEALRLADEFFLVSAAGVAKRDEIPNGWGWLEVETGGRRLLRRVNPTRNQPDREMGRGLASLLVRRASEEMERVRKAERYRIRKEERADLQAEIEERLGEELPRLREEVTRLRRSSDAVWRALGVTGDVLREAGEERQDLIREALVSAGLAARPYQYFRSLAELQEAPHAH